MATPVGNYAKALTGGGAYSVDSITGYADNDVCITMVGDVSYLHQYDSSKSAAADNSPWIIVPDDNSTGTGAWVLQRPYSGVIQVVTASTSTAGSGSTTMNDDNSTPQNTEGEEIETCAITPILSTSTLIINISLAVGSSGTNNSIIAALFQDSTANALASTRERQNVNENLQINFTHIMTSGTTSETTFKARAGTDGTDSNNIFWNRSAGSATSLNNTYVSSIVIMEIA